MLCLLPVTVLADDLWVSGGIAQGSASGQQVSVSRTLNNFGLEGVRAGASHHRVGNSWWTLLEGGINRRIKKSLILSGTAFLGPGQIDERNFGTRKLVVGATWIVNPTWFADLSDTYINIDETVGHVLSASLTRTSQSGVSIALNGIGSVGSGIDTRQLGARFNKPGNVSWMGGVYIGETRNPITLGELEGQFSGITIETRQAYVGASIPVGRFTLLTTFDVLRLNETTRSELTFVLKVPLGDRTRPGS